MSSPNDIEVTFGKGISATLCVPGNNVFAPPTNKAALILHGQGGHRNYCYQKQLARRLASDLGIYSLRIDFRGCGSSGDNENDNLGRVLSQDVDDIQQSAEFLTSGANPLSINFTLSSIIAHSRGSVAMFLWAMEQDRRAKAGTSAGTIIVPNLINCSSRFQSHTVLERYPLLDADFEGMEQIMLRHGKYQPVVIPKAELLDLAEVDLSGLKELSTDFSVMSVYGLEDNIIPIVDSSLFANILNRGYLSHRLELVPLADHNFFGTVPIEDEDTAEEYNPYNLPTNSNNLVNYNGIVTDKIMDYLTPENELLRFLHHSGDIGRLSRWKQVEGVSNFRDIGGWRISLPRYCTSPSRYYVRHNLAFRCANVARITESGLASLNSLGITTMFDLRSDNECNRDGIPQGLEKFRIKRVHTPVYGQEDYSPQAIAIRYTNLMTSWSTYVNVYDDILSNGKAFTPIFEFIRDRRGEAFLFHCTAGKDRTGVLSMLILELTGLDKSTIAKEYELTTIGLKPDHETIRANVKTMVAKVEQKNPEAVKEMAQGRENWSFEVDGFNNLISSRYESMLATIELLNHKYGGIVQYLKEYMNLTEKDILQIYDNLVINDTIGYFKDDTFIEWSHRNTLGPNL